MCYRFKQNHDDEISYNTQDVGLKNMILIHPLFLHCMVRNKQLLTKP